MSFSFFFFVVQERANKLKWKKGHVHSLAQDFRADGFRSCVAFNSQVNAFWKIKNYVAAAVVFFFYQVSSSSGNKPNVESICKR